MLFQKKNKEDRQLEDTSQKRDQVNETILQMIQEACQGGHIDNNAFVLLAEGIYIYADVISMREDVVQVIFQIHHKWFHEPVVEAIAASGDGWQGALRKACQDFVDQVLQVVLMAVRNPRHEDMIEGFTQSRHYFHVYRSEVYSVGERERTLHDDFWGMIGANIAKRLGNAKTYWVKVFLSKKNDEVLCEVRINGSDAKQLSASLLTYIHEWKNLGTYHTEKQWFLLVQDDKSYEEQAFSDTDIANITNKTILELERCHRREDYHSLRNTLSKQIDDVSLAYEMVGLIPELYCIAAYPELEVGERLFLIRKNGNHMELYQTQLDIYHRVEQIVKAHLKKNPPSPQVMQDVLQYSATARAVKKALAGGDGIADMKLEGIGFVIPDEFQIY